MIVDELKLETLISTGFDAKTIATIYRILERATHFTNLSDESKKAVNAHIPFNELHILDDDIKELMSLGLSFNIWKYEDHVVVHLYKEE